MKLLQIAATVAFLSSTVAVHAQKKMNATKTMLSNKESVESQDTILKSEAEKNKYKSKQWRQGIEVKTDTTKESTTKPKAGMGKKRTKQTPAKPHAE